MLCANLHPKKHYRLYFIHVSVFLYFFSLKRYSWQRIILSVLKWEVSYGFFTLVLNQTFSVLKGLIASLILNTSIFNYLLFSPSFLLPFLPTHFIDAMQNRIRVPKRKKTFLQHFTQTMTRHHPIIWTSVLGARVHAVSGFWDKLLEGE